MKKRSWRGLLLVAAGALVLSACSADEDVIGTDAPAQGVDDETVVTFWHSMRGNNADQLESYVEQFNELHAGDIRVESTFQGMYDEAYTKMMQVVGTADAPDVQQLTNTTVLEMADANLLTPIQVFVDAGDVNVDSLLPAAVGVYSTEDGLLMMPFAASSQVVFYNADAFEAAGLDPENPPTTYEELQAAGEAMVENAGMEHGIGIMTDGWAFLNLLANRGEVVLNNSNGREGVADEAVFNSDAGVEIMTWLNDMYQAGTVGNFGRSHDDLRTPWYSGQIGMIIDTTAATIIHENQAEFRVGALPMPIPQGETAHGPSIGGAAMGIFKDSSEDVQRAALEFVEFLASPEIQAHWAAHTGYSPINTESAELPILAERLSEIPAMAVGNAQMEASGDSSATLGPLAGLTPQPYIADAWEAVYAGGDPSDELDKAAATVTAALKSYNEVN